MLSVYFSDKHFADTFQYTKQLRLFKNIFCKAEITEHFYGESIDLNRKHNPCKGRTDGGVEVIVHTKVMPVSNNPARTVMAKSYSLPDGEVIKRATIVCDAPVRSVLHRHFPHKYPKGRI